MVKGIYEGIPYSELIQINSYDLNAEENDYIWNYFENNILEIKLHNRDSYILLRKNNILLSYLKDKKIAFQDADISFWSSSINYICKK